MVVYLEKSEGCEGFHQIIDFLTASHIKNALTECPTLYASPIEQFWQTAILSTNEDGVRGITTTIDRKVKVFVFEASIKRHLKLEDSDGISSLPTIEIFEQLALMGITSSSSLSPQTHLSTSQPPSTLQSNQTTPITEEGNPMPYESPLQSVHSLGRDEGSLSLNELMDLCTSLSKKVASLVKKLEQTIKTSQDRRRAKVVIFDDEEAEGDPSNQGRSLIEELDLDAGISLVPSHAVDQRRIDDTQISDQLEEQLGVFSAAIALADAIRRRKSVENVHTYTKRRREVSTSSGRVSTASRLVSTAGVKTKDKGKAIMHESEPPKKIMKRVQEARFKAEQEQERIDFETALELQKQLDEREEVAAKVDQAHDIDWSDPAVLRYHTLQNRDLLCAESKEEHSEQAVKESSRTARGRRNKSLARKRAKETLSEESAKKQKLEDDNEKEELQVYLSIVPEEESLNIESLATKYLIVDWETQILANDQYYYQIKRADGSVKHYKIFSAMLYDFDRQDVLELYRLVKDRFQTACPEGYDLLLWGDLKTMMEPNKEDEIWRNQQDWNLIN
ncbi:hypothetical protein Tco_1118658 [Tanacetum coccineum]